MRLGPGAGEGEATAKVVWLAAVEDGNSRKLNDRHTGSTAAADSHDDAVVTESGKTHSRGSGGLQHTKRRPNPPQRSTLLGALVLPNHSTSSSATSHRSAQESVPCQPALSAPGLLLGMPAARSPGGVTEPQPGSSSSSALPARHTPFTDALTRHPIFASFFVPGAPPLALSSRLCVSADSSSLFFALTPTAGLLCLSLAHLHTQPRTPHVSLTPSPPVPATSSTLFLSSSSTYLAVTSSHSCCVVKLPRSLLASTSPTTSTVACRSYAVGPLSPTSSAFALLHAAFHPLSSHHILLLLSSASHTTALHLYNLTADLDQPELVVPLPASSSSSRAASFCFAASKAGWSAWTVYVLYDDGRISTVCPLLPSGVAVRRADVAAMRQVEQGMLSRTGDEDARARLSWLSETFGGERDDLDELVVSQQSSLRPLAGSAMDVGSSVLRGEGAVALISLSASAVQLARVYSSGRVDVLAGVSEVQPRFVQGPLARPAEMTLTAVDTIALPASKLPLLSLTPASSALAVLSPTAAHSLSFPYLNELAHVMSDPSLPSSAVSSLLTRVQTQLTSSEQFSGVIAGCVLADIALGRQLLLLTTEGVRVLDIGKKLTLADLRVAPAVGTAAISHRISSSARSDAAFSTVLSPYLSKYRNHHIDLPATQQPLSLSSPAAFAAFLSTLPHFQSTITDLHTLHGELNTRTAVLAAVSGQTAATIDTLHDSIRMLRDKQLLLRERLAVAAEIAAETDRRVGRLASEWRRRSAGGSGGSDGGGSVVSDAERQWRLAVECREDETRKEQRRVDEVAVRVSQLAALRANKRAVRASEQAGDGLRLGSVELGRLQAELGGQTRSIEELMADVREIRQQVDTWEEATESGKARSENAANGNSAAARLLRA